MKDVGSKRATRVGFDWPSIDGVLEKVSEELEEIKQAETQQQHRARLGYAVERPDAVDVIGMQRPSRAGVAGFHNRTTDLGMAQSEPFSINTASEA